MTTKSGHPKFEIFSVAPLPQFLVPSVPAAAMGVLLASVHARITLEWLDLLAVGAALPHARLRRALFGRLLDGITGGVLIGLGARTALHLTPRGDCARPAGRRQRE